MRSGYALRRWIARKILECEIRRPTPRRATKSVGPAHNWRYRADSFATVLYIWFGGLPETRRTRGGLPAWDKKPLTIPASLYAETATHKNSDSYHRLWRVEFEGRHRLDLPGFVTGLNLNWTKWTRE